MSITVDRWPIHITWQIGSISVTFRASTPEEVKKLKDSINSLTMADLERVKKEIEVLLP